VPLNFASIIVLGFDDTETEATPAKRESPVLRRNAREDAIRGLLDVLEAFQDKFEGTR